MKTLRNEVVFWAVLIGGLATVSCVKFRQTLHVEPPTGVIANNSPSDARAVGSANPIVMPVAARFDTLSNEELRAPITIVAETSMIGPIGVSVKITNASTEPIILPVKIQLETNKHPLVLVPSLFSSNSNTVGCSQSTSDKKIWNEALSFWSTVILIAVILLWFLICQLKPKKLDKALTFLNITLKTQSGGGEEKAQKKFIEDTPARILSTVCAIIAAIHF